MYKVIARKFRPQSFAEVIGQEHVTQTLQNAIKASRIHHAYLLCGARGIGKTTIARILAKAINCEKGPAQEPCGECVSCKEITSGTFMDVQEIDGASNTGVDDVREIRERLKYMPTAGRYKIYIIDEVHMLSTSAFNALLKSLEEPPAHVVFIFATTESHKIPATILSRCQRFDLKRISVSKVVESLRKVANVEGVSIDDDSLRIIAHEATGSLRDAQSLLDQAIAFSGSAIEGTNVRNMLGLMDRTILHSTLHAIADQNINGVIDLVGEMFTMGADISKFASELLSSARHLLVIKECGKDSKALDLPADEIEGLSSIAEKFDVTRLQRIFTMLYDGTSQISRSSFPKMYLEVLLMRAAKVESAMGISEILSRLNLLQSATSAKIPFQNSIPNVGQNVTQRPITSPAQSSKPASNDPTWEGFMRNLVGKLPQLASIVNNGKVSISDGGTISLNFQNPLYADMLGEIDRKAQFEDAMKSFYGRPVKWDVKVIGTSDKKDALDEKNQMTKKALSSDLVKQATDIFGATLHDVKTK
ncbi:MAG: DNA polymerase III subunit gamma/tau [Pseudomonadota bacterium]